MRVAGLAVGAVLVLAACAPAASLTTTSGSAAAAGSSRPLATTSPAATASPDPSPASSGTADAAPGQSVTSFLARVAAGGGDGPALTNPPELGGPAPLGSFVLGDSISLGAGARLAALGYPVVGLVGQSATDSYLRTHLSSPTAQQAPGWVIILGTNNAGSPADVTQIGPWLDTIDELRTKGSRQQVYWVTPHRPESYAGGRDDFTLDAFGAELHRQALLRPWFHVIDFDAVARLHPEWFEADGMHLHPDERGQGVLAALVAGADAVPVASPAPLTTIEPVAPAVEPEPEATTFENTPAPKAGRPHAQPTDTAQMGNQDTAPEAKGGTAPPPDVAPADDPVFGPEAG